MSDPWEDPRVRRGLESQFALRGDMLRSGAKRVGWKVGFGAPASLELMQITAPLMGFLTEATVVESGATVDVTTWQRGVVEFEVAVHLGRDVGGGVTDAQAERAVAAVAPAIELANINLEIDPNLVPEIVAGNIFHEAVIFGAPDPSRAGLDTTGLLARIDVDGDQRAVTADLEAITGKYGSIVATVASTLAANGETLQRGDVIITGSVVPPLPVEEGTVFQFALDPFDPIAVRVSSAP